MDPETFILRKKFLKENRQFYRVGQRKGCDAIMVYCRDDLSRYHIKLNMELNDSTDRLDELPRVTLIYIKNKNKHDRKMHTYSFIKGSTPCKDFSQ